MSIAKIVQILALGGAAAVLAGCMQTVGPFVSQSTPPTEVATETIATDEVPETGSGIVQVDYVEAPVQPGMTQPATGMPPYPGGMQGTAPGMAPATQGAMQADPGMLPYDDGSSVFPPFQGSTTAVLSSPRNAHVSAVSGARLGLYPGQTATERAIALKAELDAEKEFTAQLQVQVAQLTQSVNQKDDQISQATVEIENAHIELVSVRKELEDWKTEVERIQDNVLRAEQMNRETLDFIIRQLRELIEHSAPAPKDGENEANEEQP